jgi:benzoate membrane transport protein
MVTNATVAWLYAITGPLAILLAVASKACFAQDQVAAWIFGGYAIGGFLSILMSCLYRQPTGVAWSIPGAILIGPGLNHLSFAEVVGASIAAGLLIAVLGITGWVRKVMSFCPLPVVMGMVCGVFLPFGLKIITGFEDNFWIALAIVVAFIVSGAVPAIEKVLPPVLAALAAGIVAVIVTGHGTPTAPLRFDLVHPNILFPEFSLRALLELVLPLAVTVIGIHNPQGFAVLEASNYGPPINALVRQPGRPAPRYDGRAGDGTGDQRGLSAGDGSGRRQGSHDAGDPGRAAQPSRSRCQRQWSRPACPDRGDPDDRAGDRQAYPPR